MKKLLLSAVGVSALGLTFFWWPSAPSTPPRQTEAKPIPKPEPKVQTQNKKEELSVAEKVRRANAQLDEAMARTERLSSPALKAEIRKRRLDNARTTYAEFFQTLRLDEGEAREAMEIVLEREDKLQEAMDTFQRTGFTQGIRDHTETSKVEKSLAEVQLRHLLGEERYEKLADLEKENQAKAMAKAQKVISKYIND